MRSQDVSAALQPLAFLIGTWRGEGHGSYPGIEPFDYGEEVSFGHTGRAYLIYTLRTWHPDGSPSHHEAGFLRVVGDGRYELVLAQSGGRLEYAEGSLNGTRLELVSREVVNAATAHPVEAVMRTLTLDGEELRSELSMAAMGHPMQPHVASVLRSVPG
jgi:THAP4-like, heme-binding beta-barrel domain